VANRDLKLENLLLCSNGADAARPLLKIGDFGFSKHDYNSSARTRCGTEAYMAPEVVCCNGRYMAKVRELWVAGGCGGRGRPKSADVAHAVAHHLCTCPVIRCCSQLTYYIADSRLYSTRP
jgi:serine/threonine protein kinase